MKKYERSKELSYAECVKMVCGNNIILCNEIAKDEVFHEELYNHLYDERSEEIKNNIESIETLEDAEDFISDYFLSDDIIEGCEDIEEIKQALNDNIEEIEESVDFPDIYQYYLTSVNEHDLKYNKEYLKTALSFVWCETLQLYVLCVYHFGTPWGCVRGVTVPCDKHGIIIKE